MTAAPSLSIPAGERGYPSSPRGPHQAQQSHVAPGVDPVWLSQSEFHGTLGTLEADCVTEVPQSSLENTTSKLGGILAAGPTRAFNVLKCIPRVQ